MVAFSAKVLIIYTADVKKRGMEEERKIQDAWIASEETWLLKSFRSDELAHFFAFKGIKFEEVAIDSTSFVAR